MQLLLHTISSKTHLQNSTNRLDRGAEYSLSHTMDVGVVNPCLPSSPHYLMCLTEPSRAPGRLRARSVSASEVEVTWKPLAWSNNRRRILGYEVKTTHAHTITLWTELIASGIISIFFSLDNSVMTLFVLMIASLVIQYRSPLQVSCPQLCTCWMY